MSILCRAPQSNNCITQVPIKTNFLLYYGSYFEVFFYLPVQKSYDYLHCNYNYQKTNQPEKLSTVCKHPQVRQIQFCTNLDSQLLRLWPLDNFWVQSGAQSFIYVYNQCSICDVTMKSSCYKRGLIFKMKISGEGGLKIFLYRSILQHYPNIPYTIPNLISFREKKYCFF